MQVNFNVDIGEGFGVWPQPDQIWKADCLRSDALPAAHGVQLDVSKLMSGVSSVNLACGFHGGDPLLIKKYIKAAIKAGCDVGAHPSYPDLAGFGLRYMEMEPVELIACIQYQIAALDGLLFIEGQKLSHVKCHGALYNRCCADEEAATAVAIAVSEYRQGLPIMAPVNSQQEIAARKQKVPVISEVFSDRAYNKDGTLVSRSKENAMIRDADDVAARVLQMVVEGSVSSIDGIPVEVRADTVCFHADSPGVDDFIDKARQKLLAAGFKIENR